MSRNWEFLSALLLFDGLAVAWGLWEIRSLRRGKKKPRNSDPEQKD